MPITNAPFYPLAGFWLGKSRVEAIYRIDGQTYHIRQAGRYIYYHLEGADSIEQTCFVCCDDARGLPEWPSKVKEEHLSRSDLPLLIEDGDTMTEMSIPNGKPKAQANSGKGVTREGAYPEAVFAAQIRGGKSGRYALYTSRVYRDCAVILFFRQNGTGICLHNENGFFQDRPDAQNRIAFRWNGQAHGFAHPADILSADWQTIAALCEDALTNQVAARLSDPFMSYEETPDELLEYACGSEQALEQLTRCILHIHPALFKQKRGPAQAHDLECSLAQILITFKATTTKETGGPQTPLKNPCLRLLELAFEYNTLRGGEWRRVYDCKQPRRQCYALRPYHRQFNIAPPSMHEQAESLLFLHDWLDGKVSDKERRRLLRLDAPGTRQEDTKA